MRAGLRRFAAEADGQAWAAVAMVAVCGFAAVMAVAGLIADGGLGPTLAVGKAVVYAAGAALAAGVVLRLYATLRGPAGSARVAHGHGEDRRSTAEHEAGHVVLAQAVGCRDVSARIMSSTTGYTSYWTPDGFSVRDDVAISIAGEYASGSSAGCGSDRASARKALGSVPWSARGRERDKGQSYARRILSSRRAEVQRIADRLERTGRYR